MFPRLPPVTRALLIINGVIFGVQALIPSWIPSSLALWPLGGPVGYPEFSPLQLLTYGFLHGGFSHLFFNMFALYMFGCPLELTWGPKRFLTYYLVCIAGAGLCQLLAALASTGYSPVVGASGGVFGLLLAFGMLFPYQRVMLLFPPIPMKARTFVIVFGAAELLFGLMGWQPGIAHFAHLGGMLFGWLLIRYWRGQPPFNRRGPPYLRRVK